MTLHPDVQSLLSALRELEDFLKQHGQDFWSVKVRQAADEVAHSDAHGVRRFLGLLGGMGSLNDVVLHREGKTLVAEQERLTALTSKASELAYNLRNEVL